jgi:U3 small nucleolar RNA-associated protein 3
MGQQYLLTKALLQSSAALNLAMYLLLKAEQAEGAANESVDPAVIQSHPVMLHLQKLNALTQNLEDGVETRATGLSDQVDSVVKAAALLGAPEGASDDDDDEEGDVAEDKNDVAGGDSQAQCAATESSPMVSKNDSNGSASSESDVDDLMSESDAATRRALLTEARFGLRPNEVAANDTATKLKRKRPIISDAGDDDVDETRNKTISQSLATTLNSIEQRSGNRKRMSAPLAEHLDDQDEDDGERGWRSLEKSEAELGKGSDEEDRDFDEQVDDDNLYAQVSRKSKERKEAKKTHYRVAPKFPRVEGEIQGERAISQFIMKNRGLVPHKAKINRNPRVKKREKFRKAIISRKGAVRDVRTDEGHKYGGEETGIKTGLSRSRKLTR